MNFCDPILRLAHAEPDRTALIDQDRHLSYGELGRSLQQWSAGLKDIGLQPGDRVGIQLRDSADFALAMLGAAHAGICFVPLDWRLPAARTRQLAESFDLRLVIAEPGGGDIGIPEQPVDGPWLKRLETMDTTAPPSEGGEQLLTIKASSGTTGEPKGALATHTGLQQRLARNFRSLGPLNNLRYLSVLPLCFSGGNNFLLLNLSCGNTVILHPPLFSNTELIELVRDFQVDFLLLVPAVLRSLLAETTHGQSLFPDLQILVTGTAKLSANEKHRIVREISPRLHELYSTSAAGQIAALLPEDIAEHADSVGRPHPDMELEIVDETDQPCATGQPGRIRCRGAGTAPAYFRQQDSGEAGERLQDGWCYTGDLGFLDKQGFLHISGRADELIIRGGINIQPAGIEGVLNACAGVREAAVVGRASATHGQEPVAFVVADAGVTAGDLLTACRNHLSTAEVPAEISFLTELPRTAAGKIRKNQLPV